METKKKRIEELVGILNEASGAYYQGQEEKMSNYEWDAMFDELTALEQETGYILPDSPTQNTGAEENDDTQVPDVNLIRLYEFDTLDDVIAAAHGLNGYFTGTNTLYKDPADELYKLVLHQSSLSPEDFNRVCNILTEYGQGKAFSLSGEAYLTEHGELISDSALQQLIQL